MELQKFMCTVCGAPLGEELNKAKGGIVKCPYCQNTYTVPQNKDDDLIALLQMAQHELDVCHFDEAIMAFDKLIEKSPNEAEFYFGKALAEYNIQYLKDEVNNRLQPICHKLNNTSFKDNKNYLKSISLATNEQLEEYKKKAEEIDQVSSEFNRLAKEGYDYDTFICVKVTDDAGNKTTDYGIASEIYFALKEKGYKPFFSEYSLKNVTGADYEAHILYALKSSKSMLIVCTNEEYLNTKWVKNEYSRYLKLIDDEEKDSNAITLVFKENPIERIPGKKGKLQGISLNNVTAMDSIEKFVSKYKDVEESNKTISEKTNIEEIEALAKNGDKEAQYNLGNSYFYGKDGMPLDLEKGAEWYEKAASQGNPDAEYAYGICLETGKGVSAHDRKARQWIEQAANHGNIDAIVKLAEYNYKGFGANNKDLDMAAMLYEKAANLGNAKAQNNLGNLYLKGEGVKKKFKKALYYWNLAAEQGYTPAKNNLELAKRYKKKFNPQR